MSELKNKPENSAFKQQRLPAFQPIYTPKVISIIFFILAAVLYIFGFPIYALSNEIIEVSKRYDDHCGKKKECKLYITIDEEIPEPVYVYYELSNFYQNHRLYVRSRSYTQLRDGKPLETELDLCKPAKYNKDFKDTLGFNTDLSDSLDDVAVPCGMIAKSLFNDDYKIGDYKVNDEDIVYSSDKDIFKNGDESKQWMKMDNRFRVWMKIAPFSTFRKLWGVIEEDVKKGELLVTIENNYDVDEWDGEKRIVLSNANAFGGKNPTLGIIFIVAGSFSLMCALIFLVTWIVYKPADYGDPLSWKY